MINYSPETLMDKKEAAEYLRVSVRTVDNLRIRQGLPSLRVGGKIIFQFGAVQDWLRKQQVQEA